MEAVVHQPFGQVVDLEAATAFERAQVEDAFMGHPAAGPPIEHGVMGIKPFGNPVGRQQGHGTGLAQAGAAHHADIHPADRQDAGAAPGGPAHRPDRLVAATGHQGMAGQEGHQVGRHRDRSHPRTTAAMGDAEGLVQVEMADIGAKAARFAEAHLGIEVGAIEVHLAAMAMHQGADGLDRRFKHPMGGGIGDHQGGQLAGMGAGLGLQVGQIDVAGVIAGHGHHLQTGHHGAGWIGAVGAGGD